MASYGDFPTIERITDDYKKFMVTIENIRTIEQVKELIRNGYQYEIEIGAKSGPPYALSIKDFEERGYKDEDIDYIKYEIFGCLSYIYDRFDGKPIFDVYSGLCDFEFIKDITISDLSEESYLAAINEALETVGV